MGAARKQDDMNDEVRVVSIRRPVPADSEKPEPRRIRKKPAADVIDDATVLPQLAAGSPASRVETNLVDLERIIGEVSHVIATTKDHYKCIMFTDLESSTEYKRSMGHTKGYMRNRLFCDLCEDAVRQHNGQVVKRLGDGVMVVFEHAIDAVMASMLIKRSIAGHKKRLKKVVGSMHYRIGITCGYVKEIPGKPKDYIGHAMDKGARIQTHARRNQILIDEIMYGLIHTKIRDYSADILIGAPKNKTLKGVGVSTLYEVSPKQMGLESGMVARVRNMFR